MSSHVHMIIGRNSDPSLEDGTSEPRAAGRTTLAQFGIGEGLLSVLK